MSDTPDLSLHPVVFGDDDPEDAWDASDALALKVDVIRRWVASIEDNVGSGDYLVPRERYRKLDARATIAALIPLPSTPPSVRIELSALDERLDDVAP